MWEVPKYDWVSSSELFWEGEPRTLRLSREAFPHSVYPILPGLKAIAVVTRALLPVDVTVDVSHGAEGTRFKESCLLAYVIALLVAKLLVADEPMSMLDANEYAKIMNLLKNTRMNTACNWSPTTWHRHERAWPD